MLVREHRISENTYRLQRALVRWLVVQVVVPFSTVGLSLVTLFSVILLELPFARGT